MTEMTQEEHNECQRIAVLLATTMSEEVSDPVTPIQNFTILQILTAALIRIHYPNDLNQQMLALETFVHNLTNDVADDTSDGAG
jgi:hypothetical protein